MRGEVKQIGPITLENIADALLLDGLATQLEIDALLEQLSTFAADPQTLVELPRIVQAWGRRPV